MHLLKLNKQRFNKFFSTAIKTKRFKKFVLINIVLQDQPPFIFSAYFHFIIYDKKCIHCQVK